MSKTRAANDHDPNRFDVVGIGRNCVDYLALLSRLPPRDSKVPMEEFLITGGGQATTALAALSRLGVRTAYLGVFGGDRNGRMIREELEAAGVDISGAVVAPDLSTPAALILVDRETAGRTIAYQSTPPGRLRPEDVDIEIILSSRCLLIDPHATLFGLSIAARVREEGIPIIYDAEHSTEGLEEMLAAADYIVASRDIVENLGLNSVMEALDYLWSFSPRAAVITLGKEGALARDSAGILRKPAFTVTVVDTTAAGDAFHAGFAYGVLKNWDLGRILEFSNAVGALVCRGLGGRQTLPTLSEVETLLGWR